MSFDGRQLLMEDNLWLKMGFNERQALVENNLKWRATFDGEQLTIEEDLRFHSAFTLSVSIGIDIQNIWILSWYLH